MTPMVCHRCRQAMHSADILGASSTQMYVAVAISLTVVKSVATGQRRRCNPMSVDATPNERRCHTQRSFRRTAAA